LFELNPALDLAACAETYARDGIVRIPDVLSPASAEAVAALLESNTPWRLTVSKESETKPPAVQRRRHRAAGPGRRDAPGAGGQ
jgi:SM-20-related protein